ncbi:MAG TPA: succinate dehydrogenase cytochrome b subunit [Leptospiraceae bacterium]|nr:succinate dehydrogenase cytochrome b subunit [Leptospiraceae bacterium]HMW05660.1 succinate dehydrogenase cytochrome b subunit [Leptospiraceae bacterium]HMX34360.1 succinate dehydrogenase cytochrome b subunit [Leptospiraceae bacterium]HMY30307.1 succinate dehydrogenase cytochrome b subunit [Leptospiraceae bacterium]HMZ63660.1 succinate dehydrogenase cytochrome b subunit [Leptospiraceae bacterium]
MSSTKSYLNTSVGKKVIMAISGLVLYGFVIMHMLGNLQVFSGPEKLNAYGHFLQSLGGLLWIARLVLLGAVGIHIYVAVKLTRENMAARPIPYYNQRTNVASYASRTMRYSGLIIFAFIVYHLLHFTLGVTDPAGFALKDSIGRHDIYGMVISGFSNPLVSGSYIIAMALLCLHLSHGFFSLFQSLGINQPEYDAKLKLVSNLFALGIFVGNSSMPIAVLLKIVA